MDIECGGFVFLSNFDSGNLGRVEQVTNPTSEDVDFEFNIWTRPDCAGTEFENSNRTWFYFGIKGGVPLSLIKLNIMNLNKQSKMYAQGMSPVFRICPGRPKWERIRERPTFCLVRSSLEEIPSVKKKKTKQNKATRQQLIEDTENSEFMLSFKHRLTDTFRVTVYFAFTYPFSYSDLQIFLNSLELVHRLKVNNRPCHYYKKSPLRYLNRIRADARLDDVYYHRECLCYTMENKKAELLTITSYHNMTNVREPRLHLLFPDIDQPRPFIFQNKKVVLLSARVHPGETPSSYVLNGIISTLVNRDDPVGQVLRRHFVFKIVPMLNPDGVVAGNYRTDTRGVNLNRVYNSPIPDIHPTIFAARSLVRFYHYGIEHLDGDGIILNDPAKMNHIEGKVSGLSLGLSSTNNETNPEINDQLVLNETDDSCHDAVSSNSILPNNGISKNNQESFNSGLYLYIDMHGHASKKGIFMYGNHFENIEDNVECMLLPKLISLNSQHFHFESCNFSEKIMYLKDRKDGSSREGCGRVAVLKATGLVRSYTLECNYNTGKILNQLPPLARERDHHNEKRAGSNNLLVPPKYTPQLFEEVGKSILVALMDLNNLNPNSRLANSHHRTLSGVREWLRQRALSENSIHQQHYNALSSTSGLIQGSQQQQVRGVRGGGRVNQQGGSTSSGVAKLPRGSQAPRRSHKLPAPNSEQKVKRAKLEEAGASSRLPRTVRLEKKSKRPDQRRKKLKPK